MAVLFGMELQLLSHNAHRSSDSWGKRPARQCGGRILAPLQAITIPNAILEASSVDQVGQLVLSALENKWIDPAVLDAAMNRVVKLEGKEERDFRSSEVVVCR